MECQLFMTMRQKEDSTLKPYLLVYFRREDFFLTCSMMVFYYHFRMLSFFH